MATTGPTHTVMAAAGREAAGLARRLTDRFIDRSSVRRLPSPGTELTARLFSDHRLQNRLGALSVQVADLISRRPSLGHRHRPTTPLAPFQRPASKPNRPLTTRMLVGTSTPAFHPVSFSTQRHTPPLSAAASARVTTPLLRPQSDQTVSEMAPTSIPSTPRLLERTRFGIGLPTADKAILPFGPDIRETPAAERPRAETSAGDERTGNTDYRLLGPTALRDTLRQRSGRGTLLDFSLRERLRGTLGFDPSMARLHHGPVAGEAARTLRAQAFTIGQDVFFGEGRFDMTSRAGLELLTHELTHVGQQTRSARQQTRFFTPQGGDAEEEEAQKTAARLMMLAPHPSPSSSATASSASMAAPEMQLAMPPPLTLSRSATAVSAPIQRTIDPRSEKAGRASSSQMSPHSVADHVYELMKQELLRDKRRGLVSVKG